MFLLSDKRCVLSFLTWVTAISSEEDLDKPCSQDGRYPYDLWANLNCQISGNH